MVANPQTEAKVRKVIIKDLPRDSTATFVASIVYGGAVEEIQIRSSAARNLTAVVRFMKAEDCSKFYEETSNGLVYKKDAKGRELVVFVELAKDVDVVGGLLQGWIDTGITRCVRAVGVESKWDLDGLFKIAERKNRKVEKIVDGQNAGGVSTHNNAFPLQDTESIDGRRDQSCSDSVKWRTQCTSKQRFPGMRTGRSAISITPQTRRCQMLSCFKKRED